MSEEDVFSKMAAVLAAVEWDDLPDDWRGIVAVWDA